MISTDAIQKLEDALAGEFGREGLSRSAEALADFSRDESHCQPASPQLVFQPSCEAQVQRALELCGRLKVPVTPSGARTGKSGGCVPSSGGLALGMARMNRILEISQGDMVAVVEPGVVTGDLMSAAEAMGLFYPPDPASLRECTIGGNIAENAGGPRAFKYGVTRDHVLGLRVALMDGSVVRTGHRSIKGVAGYDLTGLFVGSEGTLGVVTQATLKLVPLPPATATSLLSFSSLDEASQAVTAILQGGMLPRTLELMDGTAIEAAKALGHDCLPSGAGAALLVELDGDDGRRLAALLQSLGAKLKSLRLVRMDVAEDRDGRERLWEARRCVSRALKAMSRFKASEDIAVPRSRIPEMARRIKAIGHGRGIGTAVYGHAGDGNLHVNFLFDDPALKPSLEEAVGELMAATVQMGGTITGEHGVGLTKREFLPLEIAERSLALHRQLKSVLDPDHLLNPGKIFTAS